MSKKELMKTEQAVLDKLGAVDFRSISKDQIMTFVSEIPNMDKEVAIKCLEQFPDFKDFSGEIVKNLFVLYEDMAENHKKSKDETIEYYGRILDQLDELSKQPDLSIADQRYFVEKSIEVADKIAELHIQHSEFLQKIIQTGGAVAGVAMTVVGSIIGVKFIGRGKD